MCYPIGFMPNENTIKDLELVVRLEYLAYTALNERILIPKRFF